MEKRKVTILTIVGVCFVGGVLANSILVQVESASQQLMIHIVHAVVTGTSVLFYVFFTRGVNPDCIELFADKCEDNSPDIIHNL